MNNCSQAANASLVVFAGTCYTATPDAALALASAARAREYDQAYDVP